MLTVSPSLRIEQETPSQLILETPDRRWPILIAPLLFTIPLLCMGLSALPEREIWWLGALSILFGLGVSVYVLFYAPYKAQLTFNSNMLMVTLNRQYWLGETDREKTWFFSDLTDVKLVSQGWRKVLELKSDKRKMLLLDFGRQAEDAQRSFLFMQNKLKGLNSTSSTESVASDMLTSEQKNWQVLKNAEKLLNIFGIFSLLSGAMGFFTDNMLGANISLATIIEIATGIIYLACGYGVKRRIETALWVAMVVVIGERLYWFIRSGTLSGDGSWSAWLTWIFAFLIASSLWQAISSMRATEREPVFEPPL